LEVRTAAGTLSPTNVPGELFIITPFAALGTVEECLAQYQPEECLTRFQGAHRLAVAHATGDIARYREDREIEILGRLDHQVKISGVRVSPMEVSACLLNHPKVQACAVLPWSHGGAFRLAGYVVARDSASISEGELRAFVQERLPRAMVPACFIFLKELPVNANGKLDTTRLPKPSDHHFQGSIPDESQGHQVLEPNCAPTEMIIMHIWSDLLKCQIPHVDSDFFALGGHSLLAVQAVSRVRKAFNRAIDIQQFFKCPTVAELARQAKATVRAQSMAPPVLTSVAANLAVPISFTQRRLWLLYLLEPGANAYNMSGSIELPTNADRSMVQRVLAEVFWRHEALRTRFRRTGEEVHQVADVEQPPTVAEIDVATLADFEARASEVSMKPFVLEEGPLLRATLFSIFNRRRLLTLTVHHIVCDAWSWGLATDEIARLIKSYCECSPCTLPPIEHQYRDYTVWQRNWLAGAIWNDQLSYWTRQLASPLEPQLLPRKIREMSAARESRGIIKIHVDGTRAERVVTLARKNSVTTFMVLLAAFKVLLSKVSGKTDILVGSDTLGRGFAELERMVGFFVGTVVLRTDLSAPLKFSELLRRVRTTVLDAYACQDVPFDSVVEAVRPERNLSQNPLFQVMFRTPPIPVLDDARPPIIVPMTGQGDESSKFDLTVVVSQPQRGGVTAVFEYNREALSDEQIHQLAQKYDSIITSITDGEDLELSWISTGHEPSKFPDSHLGLPLSENRSPCALLQFMKWVNTTPAAIAIRTRDQDVSYAELDLFSRQASAQLRRLHCSAGDSVAIVGKCDVRTIAAFFGVLRVGCVAVLIDEKLPENRIRRMLDVTRPRAILNTSPGPGLPSLRAEMRELDLLEHPLLDEAAPLPLEPGSPAYIFFTSGSTGTPKGVVGRLQGLSNFIAWESDELKVKPADRIAQLTTVSFDAVLREIFLPLCCGASLVIPPEPARESAQALLHWCDNAGITIAHTVPSVIANWLTQEGFGGVSLERLRVLCLSGEPLHGELASRWYRSFPKSRVRLYNFYGTTECTMIQASHHVSREFQTGVCPIGKPIRHTQIAVLNPAGNYCGVGEPGEIVIRSLFGQCRYLNPSESDTERFFPNPFSLAHDEMLYRSGDRGSLNSDGTISILGRLDEQVKVRGVRVEPGEVASLLHSYPGVVAALVLPRNQNDDISLSAFVEPEPGKELQAEELRRYLSGFVSPAAIPQAFVISRSLARLPNGKIDRAALPEPGPSGHRGYVPPSTATEQSIAAIWKHALKLPRIGTGDNFFEIGGHSLLATAMISRVRKEFAIELPLRAIFVNQTLSAFAKAVDGILTGMSQTAGRSLVYFQIMSKESRVLHCVHPISGGVGCYRPLANALPPRYQLAAFQQPQDEDASLAGSDIRLMAHEYVLELLESRPGRPLVLAGWSFGGLVAYEMARQLLVEGEDIGAVILFDTATPAIEQQNPSCLTEESTLYALLGDLATITGERLFQLVPNSGSTEEKLSAIINSGLLPKEETLSVLGQRLRTISTHMKAMRRYTLAPISCPILLVVASDQQRRAGMLPLLGWEEVKLSRLRSVAVSGSHRTLLQAGKVEALAAVVAEYLDAQQESTASAL
jgi:amino acid adenylation domain-containing protein